MTFRRQLKLIRKREGYSQSRLARESGIPINSIRNWERSKRTPLFDAVVTLAKTLNVSIDEFVDWKPHPRQEGQPPHAPEATGRRPRGRGR